MSAVLIPPQPTLIRSAVTWTSETVTGSAKCTIVIFVLATVLLVMWGHALVVAYGYDTKYIAVPAGLW